MIIFLYGEDTYRSSQKLKEIKTKFQKEVDSSNMNLTVLDGAKLKFEEFNQQVKASPFLARKRMVIVKNLISDNKSKKIQKEIVKLLNQESKEPAKDNIIVFWEGENQTKPAKNSLWQRLCQEKFAQKFDLLKPAEINRWIAQEAKNKGLKIEPQTTAYLAAIVGNDLWQINNELQKLANYCKNKTVSQKNIDELVKAKYDGDIFKLVDALATRNKKQALKLISDQINLGANELALFSMIIRQFRILILIKDLQKNNPGATKDKIAKELKLHPFVCQKAISQAPNFTLEQLKNIYQELLNIDLQLKTTSTKLKTLLTLFIAKI